MPGGLADPQQLSWTIAAGAAQTYRKLTKTLAASTAAGLLALLRQLTDKRLTGSDLVTTGALLVAASNQRAAGLADLYLAHQLKTQPLGLVAATADTDRLQRSLDTALSDVGNPPATSLPLIGQSEPLRAGQLAMTDGMQQHKVPGWTRGASADACVYCASLADGTVLPPTVQMKAHAGCSCVQVFDAE